MTDEEMAEEWVKQEYPTLQINAVAQRYIKSFLAGLKAGRPQWHDLRKDLTDLPKENTDVLIYCYGNVRQAFFRGFFKSLYGDCRVEEVIAWCEIPTFDKE
jgi:hypothetical protein